MNVTRRPGLRALRAAPPAPLDPAARSSRTAIIVSKLSLAAVTAACDRTGTVSGHYAGNGWF